MCTVVILRRPDHDWPLLIAANRDEMKDRHSAAPARHWPDRPDVIAGMDELAGGTWLGMNDDGLVACVLNRVGTLGSHPDYRSRGELPLEALDHAEAEMAADAFEDLNPEAYRPFNLIVADHANAWWVKNDGVAIQVSEIGDGLSMLSARDLNDTNSDRVKLHLPRFRSAPAPDPEQDDWMAWTALMSSRKSLTDARGAMQIETDMGFETVSSSLIAVSKPWDKSRKNVWKYCQGKPGENPFYDIDLD